MSKTMSCFCKLIVIENLYCINRNYLIENELKKKICSYISFFVTVTLIVSLIFDIITVSDTYMRAFQIVLLAEMIQLISSAMFRRNSFTAIASLDRKCRLDDAYFEKLSQKVRKIAYFSVLSAVLDAIGLYLLEIRVPVIVILVIFFSALDSEWTFMALVVESLNLRLSTLKDQHPNTGCRIYKHILVVVSYINEEYTVKVLVMLGITVLTTVIYSFIIFLAEPTMIWKTSIYLIWREMKSLYSLLTLCSAAARTEKIRRRLAFHLAARFVLDPTIGKGKNPKFYKTIRRWYTTILSIKPCYISGSVLVFNLAVPLKVIDTSISYMIIIIQIYVAYK